MATEGGGGDRAGSADGARADVRNLAAARGHPTDNALTALDRLEQAFAAGELQRTPFLDRAIGDLRLALAQDEGQRLGGKSAEAARFILRAIVRGLDEA